jgi:hypothetical protein
MIFSAKVIASETAASAAGVHQPLQPESFRAASIDAAIKSTRLRPSSMKGRGYHLRLLFAIRKIAYTRPISV